MMFYSFYYGSDIFLKYWPENKINLMAYQLFNYFPIVARVV
jgi:hypothetical protein